LVVAGDVSHSLAVVARTLAVLKTKFDEVFYTVTQQRPHQVLARERFVHLRPPILLERIF
jgi:hypothetical protein